MAVSDGETITVVKDMGLVSNVFDERTLAALTGHLAIGHTRYRTTGASTWRNAQPFYRDVGAHTFALGHNGNLVNTEELAAEAGMLPGTVTSDSDLVAELIARELAARPRDQLRRAGARAGADRGAAHARGRLLVRAHGRGPRHRRPRSARLPAARASASSTTAGCWPRRPRRSTSSAPTSSARSIPARWSSSTPPAAAPCGPFPEEQRRPQALPVRVRLLLPPRRPPLRPERPRRPGAHGRAAGRAGPGRGRPGDGRARVGHARGRGLRPRQRHPLRPGPGEEPLHRPHLHRPQPGDAGARRAHEAQPAARQHRRQAPRGASTTRSCAAPPAGRWSACCARPAPPRCTCAISSPPYRWPCFYGMDTGTRGELIAANMSVEEIRDYLNVDTLAYLDARPAARGHRRGGAGFCDACLTGDYPVEVPVEADQGRARGRRREPSCESRCPASSRSLSGDEATHAPRRPAEHAQRSDDAA